MRRLSALLLLFISVSLFGQEDLEKISDSLTIEGAKLYKSEMASWYGTDIFLEKYKNKENVGGYFSYSDNNVARCIFFSKGDTSKVIGTIVFETSYNVNTAEVDLNERNFSSYEYELYRIRNTALNTINSGDTLFKFYKNSNLNLIPLITNGEKKVYVLTGPRQNGVVIFGNDYLLTFNENSELVGKKQLHKNLITVNYQSTSDTTIMTMHTHLPETGGFITATDICTLMLYEKFAKWEQHYVISKNYVSIWNCNKNILTILTKEVWDNIYKDQKKSFKN